MEERIQKAIKEKNAKRKKRNSTFIIYGIFALIVFYAIRNRSFEDVKKYSFVIAVSIAVVILMVVFIYWWSKKFPKPKAKLVKSNISFFIGLIFLIPVFGLIYYSVGVGIKDLFLWIQTPTLSKNGAILFSVFITIALGIGLFYFRLRLRSVYGLTEVIAGIVVAANRVATENPNEITKSGFYLAILTASVYLVVRGLDNIHQGLTKEPYDPIARKLKRRFNQQMGRSISKDEGGIGGYSRYEF